MNDFTTARVAMFALQDAVQYLQWDIEDGQMVARFPLDQEAQDLFMQGLAMFAPR